MELNQARPAGRLHNSEFEESESLLQTTSPNDGLEYETLLHEGQSGYGTGQDIEDTWDDHDGIVIGSHRPPPLWKGLLVIVGVLAWTTWCALNVFELVFGGKT